MAYEQHKRSVVVKNKLGMHARAAAVFVKIASNFQCRINVRKGTVEVNGKSIMGLLMLAAASGATVEITATGIDAAEAIESLAHLVERGFDEK